MSRPVGQVIREVKARHLRLEQSGCGKGCVPLYQVVYSPEDTWENSIWNGVFCFHSTHSRSHAYAAFDACNDLLCTAAEGKFSVERACQAVNKIILAGTNMRVFADTCSLCEETLSDWHKYCSKCGARIERGERA